MRTRLFTALAATAVAGAGLTVAPAASARTVISVGFGTGYHGGYWGPRYYGPRPIYYGPRYYGPRYYGPVYRAPVYYPRPVGWSYRYRSYRPGWRR